MQIFWEREHAYADAIRERAQNFYDSYTEADSPWWEDLSDEEQFPWCLAAERLLTAQRIERDRLRCWDKQWNRDDPR